MAVDPQDARRARQIAQKHRDYEAQRDAIVRELVRKGGSLREVGELVGLTHAGVARIVKRAK